MSFQSRLKSCSLIGQYVCEALRDVDDVSERSTYDLYSCVQLNFTQFS